MKRLSLWLTVGLVLFSVSGGFARPTKSQLDSLEAQIPAIDNFPNYIRYDSIDVYEDTVITESTHVGATDYWIGVRFTPDISSFTLQGVHFQVVNPLINYKDSCRILVLSDEMTVFPPGDTIHQPGNDTLLQDTIPAPLPDRLYSLVLDTTQQFGRNVNFWILLGPVPGGADNDSIGQGWWAVADKGGPAKERSQIWFDDGNGWRQFYAGNWVIRAGGKYSDPPNVVINEVMFNSDSSSTDSARNHVWIELFNRGEIQTTENWRLINGQNTPLPLPTISFPSGAYLVVHLDTQSVEDADYSDNRGDIYLDYPLQFLDKRKDVCILQTPDFDLPYRSMLGWNFKNLSLDGDSTAVTQPEQAFLNRNLFRVGRVVPRGAVGPLLTASPGVSVGRDSSSSDTAFSFQTLSGTEWKAVTFLGGPNSAGPTMGGRNIFPMEFDTVRSDTVQQSGSWMVMLYMAGDYGDSLRSPDRWYFDALNQIERALPQAPRNVNVAVLYDTRRGKVGGEAVSQAGATFLGTLKRDTTDQVHNLKLFSPSLNTGLPTTLSNFIAWAKDSLLQSGPGQTADHYVLALKGDGAGWQGLCGDEGDGSRLEIGELKSALEAGLGGDTLDLLIFDAPSMAQIEVATQVQGLAKFMVASPEVTGAADFDYERFVKMLAADALISADSLARFAVSWVLAERLAADPFAIWTAVQLDGLPALVSLVDTLARNLKVGAANACTRVDSTDNFQLKIRDQLTAFDVDHYGTQAQGMADFIDLKNLARKFSNLNVPCGWNAADRSEAGRIDTILQTGASVISRRFAGSIHNLAPAAGGLSIYFPSARQRAIPIKKKFLTYRDNIDHPFDNLGVSVEGGIFDTLRVYATDNTICYPHTGSTCDTVQNDTLPDFYPHRPAPNFVFVNNTEWDEFLIRYYKPVADAGPPIYLSKNVGEMVSFSGRGSSDPDSDSLQYFWDLFHNEDWSTDSCNSYAREDLDKDCFDALDDDSNLTGNTPTFSLGYQQSGTYIVTLHVWDDNDITKPYNLRKYQTAKSTSNITVNALFGYLVEEDNFTGLLPPSFYEGRIERIGIDVNRRQLLTCPDRQNATIVNTIAPDENPLFWQTGTHTTCLFPSESESRLKSRLDENIIPRGVWIFAPKLGEDAAYQNPAGTLRELFRTYFGVDTVRTTTLISTQLLPVVDTAFDSIPVLQSMKTIFPIHLRTSPAALVDSLESLGVVKPITGKRYPLLKDEHGNVVAIAIIQEFSGGLKRGRIISSFGLEHIRLDSLSDTLKLDALLSGLYNWMFTPTERIITQPVCMKGDLDSNGILSPADVVKGLNCILAGTDTCNFCASDVADSCGTISPADFVQLLRMVFNGDPSLCTTLFRGEAFKAIEQKSEKAVVDWMETR